MHRLIITYGLLAIAAIRVPLLYSAAQTGPNDGVYDGDYELVIRIRQPQGERISAVACHSFVDLPKAKEELESKPLLKVYSGLGDRTRLTDLLGRSWKTVDPYSGEDLTLTIPTAVGVRTTFFGTTNSDWQHRGLLIVAEFEKRKLVTKLIEIPRFEEARALEVELP